MLGDAEKVLLLRVQLYAAAQLFKGEDLAAFTELIREIAMLLEIVPMSSMSEAAR